MPKEKAATPTPPLDRVVVIDGQDRLTVGKDLSIQVGKKLRIEAGDSLELVVGKASLLMKKDGSIVIKGRRLSFEASEAVDVKASGDVVIRGGKIAEN